jgi:Tfp pilus assembly protein FimT
MVSIALFSIVVVVVAAAYLNLLKLDKDARATVEIANNLNFVVDTMSREIRTGTNYGCNASAGTNCPFSGNTPGSSFVFTDDNGNTIEYTLSNGQIRESVNGSVYTAITDSLITVNTLHFFVSGASPGNVGNTQPQVTIVIQGTITANSNQSPIGFDIETTAEQRQINL